MGYNEKRQVDLFHSYRWDFKRCLLLSSSRKTVSRALFQRELHLDYQRALHFIDLMTSRGYLEPGKDNALRRVKISAADLTKIAKEFDLEN